MEPKPMSLRASRAWFETRLVVAGGRDSWRDFGELVLVVVVVGLRWRGDEADLVSMAAKADIDLGEFIVIGSRVAFSGHRPRIEREDLFRLIVESCL
jgi:hypothetical protein